MHRSNPKMTIMCPLMSLTTRWPSQSPIFLRQLRRVTMQAGKLQGRQERRQGLEAQQRVQQGQQGQQGQHHRRTGLPS
jgi:hypothetical protein